MTVKTLATSQRLYTSCPAAAKLLKKTCVELPVQFIFASAQALCARCWISAS